MLSYLLSGNMDKTTVLLELLIKVFIVACILPVHEYAHAYVATKLGDDTARLSGRLTLNPMAHIDIFGALLLIFVGFGYAKPVPVNINNFKDRKKGMALTALAGPVSNLIMAFISLILYNVIVNVFHVTSAISTVYIAAFFFRFVAMINVNLAVFNLLPIPPLDGSRIINMILPDRYYYKIMQYERQIMLVMMALLFFGVLTVPLSYLSGWVYKGLYWLTSLPFTFF